ncbi:MAG: transporter substrate-binding domain-containing protein, partial [Planctomycetes bacterium]|nr:transporter substrate-binding domain-containing protein [Planctomycetota bacterium]
SRMAFTDPYTQIGKGIYVRAGNPLAIHAAEDLAGKRVGYERGNLYDQKLLRAIDGVTPVVRENNDGLVEELVRCPYFGIERHTSAKPSNVQTGGRFRIVMMLSGSAEYRSGQLEGTLSKGATLLIPAACPEVELKPQKESVWLEIDKP